MNNNHNLPHSSSNLNSSEETYLNLVNSYITATRDILNGYITFETGITRIINNQVFRNFIRPSLSSTQPNETTTTTTNATTTATATRETEANAQLNPIIETPVSFIRREMQIPNAPPRLPSRPLPLNSTPPLSPIQIPTPVRLTSRLDTPPLSQTSQSTQNVNASTPRPTPPFASSFVRYRLPVPIGPPRRVPSTNASTNASTNVNTNASTNVNINVRVPIDEVPSPPSPPLPSQTWQQLRQQRHDQQRQEQQAELNSLSPIRPVEPTPLPPVPAPLTTATRLMLNLLDTPRLNDSLVYYTQIIDRELLRNQNGSMSYDTIQQQTKIIPYCTIANPLNDICPISQVHFDIIDSVMQINICKHIFNPYSLLRWFDSHSTCPMCRQEINVDIDHENEYDDEETIHMYNNGREEEPYRSQDSNHNYQHHYHDSDFSSVS